MLSVRGLEKTYGTRPVLTGADLHVAEGDAVALVGGNGSGKTTTLRCIVGLARPDAGRIVVDGIDAVARPREALARVSYLPQRPSFPGTLTVREVIGVAARLRHQPSRAVEREIELCGLAPVTDRFVSQLSGGERQRVGLAVTFLADVPVLVFDEPSASLDPLATRIFLARAREARAAGRAILYSTHVAADIDRLATRVALLRGGRVEMIDDPTLRGEAAIDARPLTPGERALQQLEARDDDTLDGGQGFSPAMERVGIDRRGSGERGLWERLPRAAGAGVGSR